MVLWGKTHRVIRFARTWLFFSLQFLCKLKQGKHKFFVFTSFVVLCKENASSSLSRYMYRANNHAGRKLNTHQLKLELWLHIHQHILVPESIIRAPFTAAVQRQRDLFWGGSALNLFSFHFLSFITGGAEWDITLSRGFTSDVLRNIKRYQNSLWFVFIFL